MLPGRTPPPPDPRRPVLVAGLGLLGLSAAVFLTCLMMDSPDYPALAPIAGTLRAVGLWLLLAGALLILLWLVVYRLARLPVTRRSESTLFSESTQLGDPPQDRDATNRR